MRLATSLLFALALACSGSEPAPDEPTPAATEPLGEPAPPAEPAADVPGAPELERARAALDEGDRDTWMLNMDAYLERLDSELATWNEITRDDEVEGVDADRLRELAATTARLQEQMDAVGAEGWKTQAEAIDEEVAEVDEEVTVYRASFESTVEVDERPTP